MKRTILLSILFATTFLSAMAQRDTTALGLTLYGKLLQVSPTLLTIEEYENDSAVRVQEVSIITETLIDGCTLDSVQLGVNTLVVLSPTRIYPPQAEIVKFDGCIAHVDVMAVVNSITATALEVTTTSSSVYGVAGTTVTFDVTSLSQYYSCDGRPLTRDDVRVGDPIYLRSSGPTTDPVVVYLQIQNDCSQVSAAEATFVSVVDSVMYLLVDNSADTLALLLDADFINSLVPGDSALPLYRCDGTPMELDELLPGMSMSVTYLISPRKGTFFQYGFVRENCPSYLGGTITDIDGNVVTVTQYSQSWEGTITSETEIVACKGEFMSAADLTVGMYVDGYAMDNGGVLEIGRLKVLDDCPYAFSTAGMVKEITSSAVTIETIDPITGELVGLDLAFDDATQVVDCTGLPVTRNEIVTGTVVTAYYRISNGAGTADMIFVMDPCVSNYVSGSIKSVNDSIVTILWDNGDERTLLFNETSKIVDCRGELYALTNDAAGARIEGTATDVLNSGLILNATVYVNCIQAGIITGTISATTDSSITVVTTQGTRDALRAPYSMITNDAGLFLDWSELTVGRTVCATIDETTQTILQAFVDVSCENGVRQSVDPTMIVGVLKGVVNNELTISTQSGEMVFAISAATQMMDEKRSTLTAENMTTGSAVRVMAKNHNTALTPIASMVVLLSTTSVDDEQAYVSDLTVYPNPASGIVTFQSAEPFDSITISDLLGARVAELRGTATFDASALAPGTYVVNAQRGLLRITTMLVKK